jgi:hypothetical protein
MMKCHSWGKIGVGSFVDIQLQISELTGRGETGKHLFPLKQSLVEFERLQPDLDLADQWM